MPEVGEKLRQAVSTNAYFMLAAKGGNGKKTPAQKKKTNENTFAIFRSRNYNK